MKPESNSIEKFAIAVGVGSMLILAAFLFADALSKEFGPYFGIEVESKLWSVVAAVPFITIAYILGAFMLVISDFCFRRFNRTGYEKEWKLIEALDVLQLVVEPKVGVDDRHFSS